MLFIIAVHDNVTDCRSTEQTIISFTHQENFMPMQIEHIDAIARQKVLRRFVWNLTTADECDGCLWSCHATGSRLDEVHPKGLALTRLHGSHN